MRLVQSGKQGKHKESDEKEARRRAVRVSEADDTSARLILCDVIAWGRDERAGIYF